MEHTESFEIPNSGCTQDEPKDAGPGVMDRILVSLIHVKEKATHLKGSSAPNTPTGIRTKAEQLETNFERLTNSPHSRDSETERLTNSPHSRDSETERLTDSPRSRDSGMDINEKNVPHELAPPPDQHYNEALGNGGEPSPAAGSGKHRFLQVSASPRGSGRSLRNGTPPASPTIPSDDLGEKIMGLLPGCHTNPYAVPHTTSAAAEVSLHSAGPASPSVQQRSTPSSPSILGKLKTERLISKLADKLHLHSPRVATESPGTPTAASTAGSPTANTARSPTANTARSPTANTAGSPTATTTTTTTSLPSANTGAATLHTDEPTTTIATATGPTEN